MTEEPTLATIVPEALRVHFAAPARLNHAWGRGLIWLDRTWESGDATGRAFRGYVWTKEPPGSEFTYEGRIYVGEQMRYGTRTLFTIRREKVCPDVCPIYQTELVGWDEERVACA